jgi:hypothetical protein
VSGYTSQYKQARCKQKKKQKIFPNKNLVFSIRNISTNNQLKVAKNIGNTLNGAKERAESVPKATLLKKE